MNQTVTPLTRTAYNGVMTRNITGGSGNGGAPQIPGSTALGRGYQPRRGTDFTLGNRKLTTRLLKDQTEFSIAASMAMRKKKQQRLRRWEQSQGQVL